MKKFFLLMGLASTHALAGTDWVNLVTCTSEQGDETASVGVETDLGHTTAISGALSIKNQISLEAFEASVRFVAAGGGEWQINLDGVVNSTVSVSQGEHGNEVFVQFPESVVPLENCDVDYSELQNLAPRSDLI